MKSKDGCKPLPKQQCLLRTAPSKRSSPEQGWDKTHHAAGVFAGLYLAYLYTSQLKLLHENQLWFSHLTELERDLSFRSESALYYSYYKQLVKASSLYKGISNLAYESNVNSIQHFSVFPEIVLASLYKALQLEHFIEPVYFYINAVFYLQGLQLLALFSLAWVLSGTSIAGCMASLFVILNREYATRANTAVALRECFAMPFIAAGILCMSLYHSNTMEQTQARRALFLSLTLIADVCAAVTWQSTQLIFLFEGVCLFVVHAIGIVPQEKVWYLLLCKVVAVLTAFMVPPGNHNPLGSIFISFTIAWAGVNFYRRMQMKPSDLWVQLWICGLSLSLHMMFKLLFFGYEDSVLMFKYLLTKLGLALFRDYELLVCMCHSAFQPISLGALHQMLCSGLLPSYVVTIALFFKSVVAIIKWPSFHMSNGIASKGQGPPRPHPLAPEWVCVVVLSLLLGPLALWATRFQYLWVSLACSTAAAGVCHPRLWRGIATTIGVTKPVGIWMRSVSVVAVMSIITMKEAPAILSQLRLMKQLHVPETVSLMQWIDSHTPHSAVFAGSCQILASISLCTGRPTTVGPHLEDDWLSKSVWETYQIYAKQDPGTVYATMKKLGAGYVVVENNLCSPTPTKCSLVGVMDLAGENSTVGTSGMAPSPLRFCETLQSGSEHLFTLVFDNQSFMVYKIG